MQQESFATVRYRDNLVWLLLLILSERPMHGYEIIKRIKELTGNQWKPAAGSIYPLLNYMRDAGLITVVNVEEGVRGGRKIVYALSEKGWQQLVDVLRRKVTLYMNFMNLIIGVSLKSLESHGFEAESKAIKKDIAEWAAALTKSLQEG